MSSTKHHLPCKTVTYVNADKAEMQLEMVPEIPLPDRFIDLLEAPGAREQAVVRPHLHHTVNEKCWPRRTTTGVTLKTRQHTAVRARTGSTTCRHQTRCKQHQSRHPCMGRRRPKSTVYRWE